MKRLPATSTLLAMAFTAALTTALTACGGSADDSANSTAGLDTSSTAATERSAATVASSLAPNAAPVPSSPRAPGEDLIAYANRVNQSSLPADAWNGEQSSEPAATEDEKRARAEAVKRDAAVWKRAGEINAQTLRQAAAQKRSGASAQQKEGGVPFARAPVYRFFNTRSNTHFYTAGINERDLTVAGQPSYNYEGAAYFASPTPDSRLTPVYRFFNVRTKVHFYTISAGERDLVQASLPDFKLEGVAYHASTTAGAELTPIYRFFNTLTGVHFYSASATERDQIIATLPIYNYEGIAFYALDSGGIVVPPAQVVLIVGDSLTEGYGTSISGRAYSFVSPGQTWVQQLRAQMPTLYPNKLAPVILINASRGGERATLHGARRIDGLLAQYKPTHVVLAQATNDVSNNVSFNAISNALSSMTIKSKAAGAQVLLADYRYYAKGTATANNLTNLFQTVANAQASTYVSITANVPYTNSYYFPDQIHLRNAAQPRLLGSLWAALLPKLP